VLSAVTFDFWQTLVRDSAATTARQRAMRLTALERVLAGAGCPWPAAAIDEAYERCGARIRELFWAADRDLAIGEQVRLVFECLEPGLADRLGAAGLAAAVQGYTTPTLHHPPDLMPGAAQAVRALAAGGVRLGIISNTGRTPGAILRKVLEGHDLLRHFQTVTYSDECGHRKPAAAIFHQTLGRLDVAPAAALHVGDNPRDDVQGARAVGMRTAHYVGSDGAGAPGADLIVSDLAELPERLAALGWAAAPRG
jgi:putative hydrolase of the HAD superfamily